MLQVVPVNPGNDHEEEYRDGNACTRDSSEFIHIALVQGKFSTFSVCYFRDEPDVGKDGFKANRAGQHIEAVHTHYKQGCSC